MYKVMLTFDTAIVTVDNDWLQELVCLVLLVPLLNGANHVRVRLALSLNQPIDGDLDSLPSLVTVHGIISPSNSREFTILFLLHKVQEFLAVPSSRSWGSVTTITKEVNVSVRNASLFGSL